MRSYSRNDILLIRLWTALATLGILGFVGMVLATQELYLHWAPGDRFVQVNSTVVEVRTGLEEQPFSRALLKHP